MEELIKELARRHVRVEFQTYARNSPSWREDVSLYVPGVVYKAEVCSAEHACIGKSWPSFSFTVTGMTAEEVVDAVRSRIHLAEPIIKARELRFNHNFLVRKARNAGEELSQHLGQKDNTYAQLRIDPRTFGGS